MEPAYPAYVDANIITGNKIIHIPSGEKEGFLPLPDESVTADVIYICSPNNPTGAVFNYDKLKQWVDYANRTDAVLCLTPHMRRLLKMRMFPTVFLK